MNQEKFVCLLAALVVLSGAGSAGLTAGAANDPSQISGISLLSANITNAQLKYLGSPEPEIDILGGGFGTVQGTKNVQVDGTLVTAMPGWSVIHWSNTSVTIQAINIIPWEHVYKIAITDGSTVISNEFSKRFLYTIDGLTPTSGLPGWKVKVGIWDIPSVQGWLVLKLGTYNFTILSWIPGTQVEAKVPTAPPGTYDVYLQKGSDVVSGKASFTVKKLFIKPPIIK